MLPFKQRIMKIVVHCAATPPNFNEGVGWIRRLHKGKGWSDVGYHWVVTRSGRVQKGRDMSRQGAHVRGHNHYTIGICLMGGVDEYNEPENNFTAEQLLALHKLIKRLMENELFDVDKRKGVVGHRDFPGVNKACPCFDANRWWREVERLPLA